MLTLVQQCFTLSYRGVLLFQSQQAGSAGRRLPSHMTGRRQHTTPHSMHVTLGEGGGPAHDVIGTCSALPCVEMAV